MDEVAFNSISIPFKCTHTSCNGICHNLTHSFGAIQPKIKQKQTYTACIRLLMKYSRFMFITWSKLRIFEPLKNSHYSNIQWSFIAIFRISCFINTFLIGNKQFGFRFHVQFAKFVRNTFLMHLTPTGVRSQMNVRKFTVTKSNQNNN